MFAVTVTLLALAWVAARTFDVLQGPVRFTVLTILVLVAGVALHHVFMALAVSNRRTEIMIKIAMTTMILGWAALMTGQFANVAFFDQARVTIDPPSWFQAWPTIEFSLLTALQVLVMLVGLVLALISLSQVNFKGSSFWTRIGRRTIPDRLRGLLGGRAAAAVSLTQKTTDRKLAEIFNRASTTVTCRAIIPRTCKSNEQTDHSEGAGGWR